MICILTLLCGDKLCQTYKNRYKNKVHDSFLRSGQEEETFKTNSGVDDDHDTDRHPRSHGGRYLHEFYFQTIPNHHRFKSIPTFHIINKVIEPKKYQLHSHTIKHIYYYKYFD